MERAVAIKKLSKLLGKKLAWRVDPKAPSREDREAAKAALAAAVAERNKLREQRTKRSDAILAADAEYQALLAAAQAASDRVNALQSTAGHHKIVVGNSHGMFFHVKAQGDSWEDVINQLTKKEQTP